MHDDEVDIDAALVARLLTAQFPRWAGRPLRPAASGTDNITYRLGTDLAVRLPRTPGTQHQVGLDGTWLPRLAPHLPLAVPELLALGEPGEGYPFNWGVYRWLDGEDFDLARVDPHQAAADLAGFVHSLQAIDATGAPVPADDPFERGTPLAPRDTLFREALDELRDEFDTGLLLAFWERSLAATPWQGPPVWIHGDLMSGNLLMNSGHLSAVIDFATLRAADPAGDLLAAWYVFDAQTRQTYRSELGVDDDTWARARGWALSLSLIAIPYYRKRFPDQVSDSPALIAEALADFVAEG
ncbi:aminoglycoside phosphotransferase family protein [Phytomonospora endophytica]|uniref:Aminoglycoside phosphotransferase (APT) family kinase protein n=1 Tax=Phytomonospora endophytica TaxID=714109 RepID=A0A841FD96_9ACTN|nr:aminoglycoside phosphotransferase family protein [Phytomonospora endophytica]MBB6033784.1 aminoglycoside phosphotransferase (APT) family kinase protein [Phytomonospora endophytica]GIG64698.1 phosphotransferase [Phytomonospora endophytica]